MKRTARLASYPMMFVGGWIFNFVYDVKFMAGFLSGWLAHSWFATLF